MSQVMTAALESRDCPIDLLEFLLPGLTHSLGNSLFTIQGHAQLLGSQGTDDAGARSAIQKASQKAQQALEMIKILGIGGASVAPAPARASTVMHRLTEYLRVPLRERGVQVRFVHARRKATMLVDSVVLCRGVLEIVKQAVDSLPSSFEGDIELDLVAQRPEQLQVAVRVIASPAQLPFPIDLTGLVGRSKTRLAALHIDAEATSDRVVLGVPVRSRG